ncbi:uncharacterized protein [Watersipora subatra]|uniref:uncharacterized protein n=1 Tax=Watersipora subatra TaxID=2589382 RepID=UPI00355C6062
MDDKSVPVKNACALQHFSMLSKTKLGSMHHARCRGSELEKLNNILQVLSRRDFQASFNKKYPAEAFKPKIDTRKAKASITKLFDNLFTHKVNWKQAIHSCRTSSLRRLYMKDRLLPSTPFYYSADTAGFSVRIREAVARIMREQGLPVAVCDNELEDSAVAAKISFLHHTLRRSSKSSGHAGKNSPKRQSVSARKLSSKYPFSDIIQGVPEELEEQGLVSEKNLLRAPQGFQLLPERESATVETATNEVNDNSESATSQGVLATLPTEGVPCVLPPMATRSLPVLHTDNASNAHHHRSAVGYLGLPSDETLSVAISTTLPTFVDETDNTQTFPLPVSEAVRPESVNITSFHKPPSDHAASASLGNSPTAPVTSAASTRNRTKSLLQIDRCESSFIHFKYGTSTQQFPSQLSQYMGITKCETYLPSADEHSEDDDAIDQFSSSIYDSLQKSQERISNEDDLAEVVAECILASAIGLALLSSDASIKISRSRFLNLRDRMSSEVMQATMKVFRISPPVRGESLPGHNITADRQTVEPFSPSPEPVLRKVEMPMNFFKRHPGQHLRRHTDSRRSSSLRARSSGLSRGSPDKLKFKNKQSKKGKPMETLPFDEESELPRLDLLTIADFSSLNSVKFNTGHSTGPHSAASLASSQREFLSQMSSIDQLVRDWAASDVVRLLEALISNAYERGVTVLPLIAREIRGRVTHVTNITELPDRLLVAIFQCLDVASLQSCQEVCRHWAFLCTRAEIWLAKCNMLGHSYGIPGLCRRICDKIDGVHTVDWQMAYRELSIALHRYSSPASVHLHPAVLASKGYSSCVAIADWNKAATLPSIATDNSSNLSTPRSTLVVSDLTSCDDQQTESGNQAPVARRHLKVAGKLPQRAGKLPQRQFVKKSRFPPLQLVDNVLILAGENNPTTSGLKRNKKSLQVKARNSYDMAGSSSPSNADLTPSMPLASKNGDTKMSSAVSDHFQTYGDSYNDLAIDIRTELIPAKQLHPDSPILKSELADQSETGTTMTQLFKTATLEYKSQFRPVMTWLNMDDYNPRDPSITKRFRGYVKPLHYVHKVKGHTDVIYSCDFDRNRVFTGGMDGIIYLWDKRSGRMVEELRGHNGSVRSLVLDSAKDVLYSASWDTTISVWDVVKLMKRTTLIGHTGAVVDIRLDTARACLFSASSDGTIRLWSTRIYKCMQIIGHHSTNINCLFHAAGILVSGGAEGKVHVYSLSSNGDYKHLSTCSTSETLKDVTSVSNIVINSGQRWDQQTRDKYLLNSVTSVYVINDLVLGGTNHGELFCWCRGTNAIVARFDLHIGSIVSIQLWCQRILTAGSDGIMKEWELGTMTCVRRLQDHPNAINCAKVNDACDTIISVGDDKLIHIWHFATGKNPGQRMQSMMRSLPVYALDKKHQRGG